MNSDPLYCKIVERLKQPIDGNAFEACAAALLCDAHPQLTPLPGGDDAGMDGAFGSIDGPYPLICTVCKDVIGNFRNNVTRYLKLSNGPKRAVIATSRVLSNRQKRNLHQVASTFGVTIENVYDGTYFANRLYRDSAWCSQLLNIAGHPSALSVIPRNARPERSTFAIGREDEIEWIRTVGGDALIVGPPGSGKTFLHQHVADNGDCLFVVSDSIEKIADAIREQEPAIVVVDDAHINLKQLEDLRRLRMVNGARYHIHANCWPSHEARVQRALQISKARVRRLEPLTSRQILTLIEELGILGPDWFQQMLIDHSDGKPGLAIALVQSYKMENAATVWSGEATARELLGDARIVHDENDRCVLAAFALGGDDGMTFHSVADALRLSELELRKITVALGSGGLIEEVGEDCLQVRPPALRPVLVRDVFFCGAASHPIHELLSSIRSPASTASVLMSARQRGASVDTCTLEKLVLLGDAPDLWKHFAFIDAECARLVLEEHHQQICHAAVGLLEHFPAETLSELLNIDTIDPNRHSGTLDAPRTQIRDWTLCIDVSPEVLVKRRETLLTVLENRVREDQVADGQTIWWAISELFRVSFDISRSVPANTFSVRTFTGILPSSAINQIRGLWPRAKAVIENIPGTYVRLLVEQIHEWCFPQMMAMRVRLPAETSNMIQQHGKQMLIDLLAMPHMNRALRTRAATIAEWAELDLKVDVEPIFDAIYFDSMRSANVVDDFNDRIRQLELIADELLARISHDPIRTGGLLGA